MFEGHGRLTITSGPLKPMLRLTRSGLEIHREGIRVLNLNQSTVPHPKAFTRGATGGLSTASGSRGLKHATAELPQPPIRRGLPRVLDQAIDGATRFVLSCEVP